MNVNILTYTENKIDLTDLYPYLYSMVVKGYKNALTAADLWNLNPKDKSKNVMPMFDAHWQYELAKCKR